MSYLKVVFFLGLTLLASSSGDVAALLSVTNLTLTVNMAGDGSDINLGDGVCDSQFFAGIQCSLRAAIQELNAQGPATSSHRIWFDIPGAGPFTITPDSPLPDIVVPIVINSITQPGASCPTSNSPANLLIVLDGSNAGSAADGLVLREGSDGSTIRGLVIGNFDDEGIFIHNSQNNRVQCNHIGLQADGATPMGNATGVGVGGSHNEIGGNGDHAARNVITDNLGQGIRVSGSENTVTNNFIGLTADGMGAVGGQTEGIRLEIGDGSRIGGTGELDRNVISGNLDNGIEGYGGENHSIMGNYIGVARDGVTPLPNGRHGIYIFSAATNYKIGGTNPGEPNIIAYNGQAGVSLNEYSFLSTVPTEIEIRGNAIYGNGMTSDGSSPRGGIDLGSDGPDTNDLGDADTGENERQNYPILDSVPGNPYIDVTLESTANTQYTIDIYRNDMCDPDGRGEGQAYLMTTQLNTDVSGDGSLTILLNSASPGDFITTTATDPNGNTSEFSNCVLLAPAATATPSPTPTATATNGPWPTPTATATDGPSSTPTATPTDGPSPTPTAPSPTPTKTGTPPPTTVPPGGYLHYLPAIFN